MRLEPSSLSVSNRAAGLRNVKWNSVKRVLKRLGMASCGHSGGDEHEYFKAANGQKVRTCGRHCDHQRVGKKVLGHLKNSVCAAGIPLEVFLAAVAQEGASWYRKPPEVIKLEPYLKDYDLADPKSYTALLALLEQEPDQGDPVTLLPTSATRPPLNPQPRKYTMTIRHAVEMVVSDPAASRDLIKKLGLEITKKKGLGERLHEGTHYVFRKLEGQPTARFFDEPSALLIAEEAKGRLERDYAPATPPTPATPYAETQQAETVPRPTQPDDSARILNKYECAYALAQKHQVVPSFNPTTGELDVMGTVALITQVDPAQMVAGLFWIMAGAKLGVMVEFEEHDPLRISEDATLRAFAAA